MNDGKAVLVTTEFRGIFFGYVVDDSKLPEQITLIWAHEHGISGAGHVPIWALGYGYGYGDGYGYGYGDSYGYDYVRDTDMGREIIEIIAQGKRHERPRD